MRTAESAEAWLFIIVCNYKQYGNFLVELFKNKLQTGFVKFWPLASSSCNYEKYALNKLKKIKRPNFVSITIYRKNSQENIYYCIFQKKMSEKKENCFLQKRCQKCSVLLLLSSLVSLPSMPMFVFLLLSSLATMPMKI